VTKANFLRFLTPNGGLWFVGNPTINVHTVDNAAEGVAWVFDAKTTDPITHVGFRYGSRTGTPPTYIAGLEGASTTTGFPDGTYKTNSGNCTATFRPPADTTWDSIWQWIVLDRSYTPTLGERLCFSIRYDTAALNTIDGSNNSSFGFGWSNFGSNLNSFPYSTRNTSGSWANQGFPPLFGVRTVNDRYGGIVPALYSTRSSATIGHRVAMKVNIPGGFGDTYKVSGIRGPVSLASLASGRTPIAKIWQGNTVLASKSCDIDQIGQTTNNALRNYEATFETSVVLNCGTDYYFGYEIADATSSGIILYGTQFNDAADNSDDGGAVCIMGRSDGTTWTDDTTVRPWMELILDDFTEPTGGSGGSMLIPQQTFSPMGSF